MHEREDLFFQRQPGDGGTCSECTSLWVQRRELSGEERPRASLSPLNKSLRPRVGCKPLSLPAGCQPSGLLQPRERLGVAERAGTEFVTGLAAKVPGVISVAAAAKDPHPGRYPSQTHLRGARRLCCFPPEEVRLPALRSRLATSPPAGRAAAAPGAWLRRAAAWRRCACRC